MWVSRKKWEVLERRVANIEKVIQSKQSFDPEGGKKLLTDYLQKFQSEAYEVSEDKESINA